MFRKNDSGAKLYVIYMVGGKQSNVSLRVGREVELHGNERPYIWDPTEDY